MGVRKIKWSKRAVSNFAETLLWYRKERSEQFAQKFFSGIMNTIDILAQMPSIGSIDEVYSTSKTIYYSFLSHPKYRIVYRYDSTTLYIVAIRATMKKYP